MHLKLMANLFVLITGKCCQYPACYDSIYNLCIDTCLLPPSASGCASSSISKLKFTAWLPCPARLNLPECSATSLSHLGKLPLECYPDIPEVLPMHFLARAGQTLFSYFRVSYW